jgi:tetratricopeptide (TPR) repeat protein
MICSNCNTLNFRDYKYCRECGHPLPRLMECPLDLTQMSVGHPPDAQVKALLERAFTAYEAGATADARMACQAALALRGESSAAYSLLGLIYEREGRLAEAIRQFEHVLTLNPNSAADREHLERLQGRLHKGRLRLPAWLTAQRAPLVLGGTAAAVVMVIGLWMAAGALRAPAAAPPVRAVPSQVRMPFGAPGTVSPGAASIKLPPPPVARTFGTPAWPTVASGPRTASSRFPSTGFGGVPTQDRMNARMQALAPRLFGARRPAAPQRFQPLRPRSLAPAPVHVAGLGIVPRPPLAPAFGAPVLPDARSAPSAPPVAPAQPGTPAAAPATPPVLPPAPSAQPDESMGGGSYIRIRPLTGDNAPDAGSAPAAPDASSSRAVSAGREPSTSSARPPQPPTGGPSLAEARLHQQNGLNLWRQGDYAASYQEYEYAAQLYRMIAGRGGADAGAARDGLRSSEQGMRASGGPR